MKVWRLVTLIETDNLYKIRALKSYIKHNCNRGEGIYVRISKAKLTLIHKKKDE